MTNKSAQSDAPSAERFFEDYFKDYRKDIILPLAEYSHAAEAYAALRTAQQDSQLKLTRVELKQSCEERERLLATERAKVAQLERERDAVKEVLGIFEEVIDGESTFDLPAEPDSIQCGTLDECLTHVSRWITDADKRATAAESALSEARERAQLIPLACQMAVLAHADQLDYCGKSAVLHVFHVGFSMSSDTDMIVGLLHDSVEDAGCSLDSIRSIFGDEVADAVNAITHPKHEPYSDYLNRVMQNPIAHQVKIVDATHNLSRTDAIQDETLKRRLKTKFTNALSKLGASGAAGKVSRQANKEK